MQTTLRIDDRLYREAKSEAAREGVTLTRFLEEGIQLRLEKNRVRSAAPHVFRVYAGNPAGAAAASPTQEEIRRIADAEQEKHDLAGLGLPNSPQS